MSNAELLKQFLNYLSIERQFSPHTTAAYQADIHAFQQFCQNSPWQGTSWQNITADTIRQWLAKQHRAGSNPKSLTRRLSALRAFFQWLLLTNSIESDPTDGLKAPKITRTLPKPLHVETLNHALEENLDGLLASDVFGTWENPSEPC